MQLHSGLNFGLFPLWNYSIAFGDFKTEISSDKESAVQNERNTPEHVDEGTDKILMASWILTD